MSSAISPAQVDKLRQLVAQGNIEAAYAYLAKRGYHYACWASGGASEQVLAGDLQRSAVPGVAAGVCRHFTRDAVLRIHTAMATGYLDTLATQFAHGPSITRDVSAQETAGFHGEVFRDHRLGIEAWTLHEPFELQEKTGGLEAVEHYWEHMLRTTAKLSLRMRAQQLAAMNTRRPDAGAGLSQAAA